MSDHESGARARSSSSISPSRAAGPAGRYARRSCAGLTGLLARPSSKVSIGSVFQDRAARYADRIFLKFGDQQLTYREANAAANRYAAVLAARGVGPGDVVGVMLRNSPNAVVTMLAAVKCGAVAGMLNYHQRGEVLAHSLGLLDAKVLVAEIRSGQRRQPNPVDSGPKRRRADRRRPGAIRRHRARHQPGVGIGGAGQRHRVLHLHLGHHRIPQGQRDDALAVAQGARPRSAGLGLRLKSSDTLYCCLPLYHNNALTVAVSSVINSGATLALGKSFSASRFWDEVIASRRHGLHLHRRGLPLPAQPAAQADRPRAQGARDRRQRAATGDLGRIHQTLRHRPGVRVLCRQRGHHRVHQRLQCAPDHRHFADAAGLRRIRPGHRRPAARRQRAGAPGARRRARPVAQPGQPAAAVRRLHR